MDTKKLFSKKEKQDQAEKKSFGMIAKKDWHIAHNEYDIVIKEGDDLSSIPEMFIEGLKTEQVI